MNDSNEKLLEPLACRPDEAQPNTGTARIFWLVGIVASMVVLGVSWLVFGWQRLEEMGEDIFLATDMTKEFIERFLATQIGLTPQDAQNYAPWVVIFFVCLIALVAVPHLGRWVRSRLSSPKPITHEHTLVGRTAEIPELVELGRSRSIGQTLSDLWQHRELLYFLVWKDIKVKYKQTALGVAWAILQPLLGMALFTVLFGRLAQLPSDGLPYPLFYYASLLSWTYFSTALTMAANSVVSNTSLITKIYFPRILLPAAAVMGSLLDLAIASIILIGLLAFYQVPLSFNLALLPFVLVLLVLFTLGVGQFLAALCVHYRDVKHALSFLVQLWFFASPIVYPISMVPENYRWLAMLNPIAGIVETSRALIAGRAIPWEALSISCAVMVVVFVVGAWYFQRAESRFADVI
jgi:lipopolysaccharide transport system permease protein